VLRLECALVAYPHLARQVRRRHLAAVEDQLARARRADPELVFLLADGEPLDPALHGERRDAFVALAEVAVRENDEQACLGPVGDPQLASLEDPRVAGLGRAGLESERVRSRVWLGQRVGAEQIGREPRQIAVAELVARPLDEQGVDERVLHIHEDCERGVDHRQLLDCQDRHQRAAARAAVRPTLIIASGALVAAAARATAQSAALLRGVVYDSLIGAAPLAGAEVWIEGTNRMARTDPAGRFELVVPAAGRYTLTFDDP